jgi:hypothetical protein
MQFSNPEFYKSAGADTVTVNARLMEIEAELETLLVRWEELEKVKG